MRVGDARHEHRDPAPLQMRDRVVEDVGAGGVHRRDARHAQDQHLDVRDVGEIGQEAVRGGEEQRALRAERDDVLAEQLVLLGGVIGVAFERDLLERRAAGDRAQREDDRDADADRDGRHEIDGHGDEQRHAQHRGVRARRAGQGPQRDRVDHPHGRGEQDPGERRQRDQRDDRAGRVEDACQRERMRERRELRDGARADVDGGARDRRRRRHPAEQRRGEVRETLAEQLTVRVVALVDAIPSATVADSRLSSAASAATASAAGSSALAAPRSTKPSDGAGIEDGSAPSSETSIGSSCAAIVATAMPTSENGMPGQRRAPASIVVAQL